MAPSSNPWNRSVDSVLAHIKLTTDPESLDDFLALSDEEQQTVIAGLQRRMVIISKRLETYDALIDLLSPSEKLSASAFHLESKDVQAFASAYRNKMLTLRAKYSNLNVDRVKDMVHLHIHVIQLIQQVQILKTIKIPGIEDLESLQLESDD